MLNITKFFILFILLFLSTGLVYADENPSINVLKSGKLQKTLSLSEIKENLKQYNITIYDPYYSKKKHYKTFKLKDFLDFSLGNEWVGGDYTDISFRAYDGYDSVALIAKLKEEGGYIVFQDIDYQDWEPIGDTKAFPGPFYIVWKGKNQTAQKGFPWPWQLESIDLITFADQFPEVVPDIDNKNSSVYKGFEIFKARCVRCHAINRQGGKIGPDLNAPKNILEYRDAEIVKAFIRSTSEFRFSHMPDHKDLSDNDLDSLIDYFIYNKNENRWDFDEKN